MRTATLWNQPPPHILFFFFNDTATTEIYTLSLHDALPISFAGVHPHFFTLGDELGHLDRDRKSTRLNSSHSQISYAVFCLKKKKTSDYSSCWFRLAEHCD